MVLRKARKRGMALITVLYFTVMLTGLTLIALLLLSRRQHEVLRIRDFVAAENAAQSGMELFRHLTLTDGYPPPYLEHDVGRALVVVEASMEESILVVTSTGSVRRGRETRRRVLKRRYVP